MDEEALAPGRRHPEAEALELSELTETLNAATVTLTEVNLALNNFNELIASPGWQSAQDSAQQLVGGNLDRAEVLIDQIFGRAFLLVAALISGLILVVVIHARLRYRRAE